MKTVVTITKDHLDKQEPADCYRCAVALALRDVTNDFFVPYVLNDRWRLMDELGHRFLTRPLPRAVRDLILLVDRGSLMINLNPPDLPLTFETDIPRKYRRAT